jgi:hypothetical protein
LPSDYGGHGSSANALHACKETWKISYRGLVNFVNPLARGKAGLSPKEINRLAVFIVFIISAIQN